ncbi:MAG: hypothetical protein WDM87_03450 [Terracidiphilus sp.]
MPNQIVPHDKHVVLLAERDIFVSQIERVLAGLGVDVHPLERVFRRDGVELRFDQIVFTLILPGDLSLINSCADDEITFESQLQRRRGMCNSRAACSDQEHQSNRAHSDA